LLILVVQPRGLLEIDDRRRYEEKDAEMGCEAGDRGSSPTSAFLLHATTFPCPNAVEYRKQAYTVTQIQPVSFCRRAPGVHAW
jgi:hypothetical protein